MAKQPKQINPQRFKGVAMLLFSLPIAAVSGLTGIGGQVAMAPTITTMLGFVPERTLGTSLYFGLWTAVGSLIGALAGALKINATQSLLLAFCATLGVMFAAGGSPGEDRRLMRRMAHTLVFFMLLAVIMDANRFGGVSPLNFPALQSSWGLVVVGMVGGVLSTLLQIPLTVLLVPGLVYLVAVRPADAIVASISVTMLAAVLPVMSHSQKNTIDGPIGRWLLVGGVIGGAAGGFALSRLVASGSSLPIFLFAGLGCALSAWNAWRQS